MADLNLTGQNAEKADIAPKLVKLKNMMLERKPIWDKIPDAKKKAWILSNKDPIMEIAWDVYKWLRKNFFEDSENA